MHISIFNRNTNNFVCVDRDFLDIEDSDKLYLEKITHIEAFINEHDKRYAVITFKSKCFGKTLEYFATKTFGERSGILVYNKSTLALQSPTDIYYINEDGFLQIIGLHDSLKQIFALTFKENGINSFEDTE